VATKFDATAFVKDAVEVLNSQGSEDHKSRVLELLSRAHGLDVQPVAAPTKKKRGKGAASRGPRGHVKQAVRDVLANGPRTLPEVVAATGKATASVRSALESLVSKGEATRNEDGLYLAQAS
jgi:hypothetical protein